MMQLRVVLFFIFFAGMWSCKSDGGRDSNKLYGKYYDSVMVIHDRTMPMMSTIDNLRERLKEEKQRMADGNSTDIQKINRLMGELNKGEDAMYEWMHGFKPDSVAEEHQVDYIQNELSDIKRMEDIMVGGIGQAESYFDSK